MAPEPIGEVERDLRALADRYQPRPISRDLDALAGRLAALRPDREQVSGEAEAAGLTKEHVEALRVATLDTRHQPLVAEAIGMLLRVPEPLPVDREQPEGVPLAEWVERRGGPDALAPAGRDSLVSANREAREQPAGLREALDWLRELKQIGRGGRVEPAHVDALLAALAASPEEGERA